MAASSGKFDLGKSIQGILYLLNMIDKKRLEHERVLQDYRILFKPWPLRGQTEKLESDEKTSKVQTEQGEHTEDHSMSEQEKAEVRLLDTMLLKAQATRHKHLKTQEPKQSMSDKSRASRSSEIHKPPLPPIRTKSPVVLASTSVTKKELKSSKLKTISQVGEAHERNSEENTDTAVSNLEDCAGSGIGVIEQSRLNALIGINTKVSKGKEAYKSAPFKTENVISKSQKTRIIQRSQAFKSRSASEERQMPPTSAPNRVPNSLKSQPNAKVTRPKSLESILSQNRNVKVSSSSSKKVSKTAEVTEKVVNSMSQNISQMGESSLSMEGQVKRTTPNPVEQNQQRQPRDVNSHKDPEKTVDDEQKPKPFCLERDGASLNIPVKLRRCYMNNVTLRKKVTYKRLSSANTPDTSVEMEFFQKLEMKLYEKLPEPLQRISKMEHTYQKLQLLLQNLNLGTFSENSPWEEVARATRTVEHIMMSYQEREHEFTKLFPERDNFKKEVGDQTFKINKKSLLPSQYWNPDCSPSSNYKLWYSSERDLKDHVRHIHDVQVYMHHLQFLKAVQEQLILLDTVNQDKRQYYEAYRSVYSLLTSLGKHSPTLVQDVSDSSDLEN